MIDIERAGDLGTLVACVLTGAFIAALLTMMLACVGSDAYVYIVQTLREVQ